VPISEAPGLRARDFRRPAAQHRFRDRRHAGYNDRPTGELLGAPAPVFHEPQPSSFAMALLKIARMGNPVLKKIADPIADPTDPQIAKLAADMIETLEDVGGNGLAAPQVHVSKRLVVYRIAAHQIPAGADFKPLPWTVLVNPVIEPLTDEKKPIWERCLSIPGLHGIVPRHTRVRCTATSLDGRPIERITRGFHAMLLQHECDHLDGILYPMRMTDLSTLAFNSELGERGFLFPRPVEEFVEDNAAATT